MTSKQNQFADFTKRRALAISTMVQGELKDMVSGKISTAISGSTVCPNVERKSHKPVIKPRPS